MKLTNNKEGNNRGLTNQNLKIYKSITLNFSILVNYEPNRRKAPTTPAPIKINECFLNPEDSFI